MIVEPGADLPQARQPVRGLAGAAELVVLTPEDAHSGLHAQDLQGGEHLKALI